jgi:ubiquitin carboxyl-terminal hydrolase 7
MCALENGIQPESIPFALQSIFYKLQYSDSMVTTTELTKSLGMSKEYVLVHQDVEEHILSFFDKLRDSMKVWHLQDLSIHICACLMIV